MKSKNGNKQRYFKLNCRLTRTDGTVRDRNVFMGGEDEKEVTYRFWSDGVLTLGTPCRSVEILSIAEVLEGDIEGVDRKC